MSNMERRGLNRFLCADLVRVNWFEENGPEGGQSTNAVLEDISALGACVQVEQPIPLNSPITVTIGDAAFKGGVCYNVYREYGYFVGIRFEPGTEWSWEMVMPQHLTNLQELGQQAAG